jgi:hypothetical protein
VWSPKPNDVLETIGGRVEDPRADANGSRPSSDASKERRFMADSLDGKSTDNSPRRKERSRMEWWQIALFAAAVVGSHVLGAKGWLPQQWRPWK